MVRNFGRQSRIIVIFILLSILPTVTAHGGEEEAAALSNSQVLMIASLAAILVYFLVNKFLASRQAVFPTSIICLASFTGLVHILLGLEDSKLLLGGIANGVIVTTVSVPRKRRSNVCRCAIILRVIIPVGIMILHIRI